MDSYVIRKERCPQCAKLGKDRGHDNLAIYSDGHSYCYSCGFRSGGGLWIPRPQEESKSIEVVLPTDVTTELPYEAKLWLSQYEITQLDINKHLCMWSQYYSRLIFPYFSGSELVAWQGRYIKVDDREYQKPPAKWYSCGKIHEFVHPLNVNSREAVLVEDIVSAIKVSRYKGSIPLFGSTISKKQLLRLKLLVDRVWYWLDPDKRTESIKMAKMSQLLGIESRVILSDKDPKEHGRKEIEQYLSSVS
jgi:hypothetical protein